MVCSSPGSSVHGIFQARILERVAISFSIDCMDHNKLWEMLKEMGVTDHLTCLLRNLYGSQEAIEPEMEHLIGSKLGKEYNKAVNCHPYLTYMQNVCLCTQSCPTFCDPMDCSTPGFPGEVPG